MTIKIFTGDCRDVLKSMPDESVHCVVTSPPYWGLRDYGIDGQLGMERSLGEYIETMVAVFREVRRVLRKDGTLWLNLGDSYAANINGRSAADTKALGNDDRTFRDKPFSTIGPVYVAGGVKTRSGQSYNQGNIGAETGGRINPGGYIKPKDLCGIPWRVAFALQEDGWYLRQDIIWSKPNPMPESVCDRCTKAHEYLFLLSKSQRYYYDQEAIKEDIAPSQVGRVRDDIIGGSSWQERGQHSEGGRFFSGKPEIKKIKTKIPGGWDTAAGSHGTIHRNRRTEAEYIEAEVTTSRNKRSVWEITTSPFPEAHFATFPPALIEPCILAGCPKNGTVLDPFGGAGTTGLVADRLERNSILIELNPEYVKIAENRLRQDAGMFLDLQHGTETASAR